MHDDKGQRGDGQQGTDSGGNASASGAQGGQGQGWRPQGARDGGWQAHPHGQQHAQRERAAKQVAAMSPPSPAIDAALKNARHTTLPMRIGLGVAMGLFGLCCVLPVLSLLIFLSVAGGLEMAAEGAWKMGLLDDASRDVFDAGVIAGLIVMLLSSLLALAAHIVRRKELPIARWTPPYLLTIVATLYFALGAIAAAAAWLDNPWNMVLASFVLTISVLLPVFVLPVWLLRWSYMGAKRTWRWGCAGPYRAGLFSGVLVLPALPILMLFFGVSVADSSSTSRRASLELERGAELVEVRFASSRSGDSGGLIEELHNVAEYFAYEWPESEYSGRDGGPEFTMEGVVPDLRPPRRAEDASRFGVCVDTLMGRAADDGLTEYERQLRRAHRAAGGIATAEDIVQETLMRVCARHERSPLNGRLEPYFTSAITNALADNYRRSVRVPQACEYIDWEMPSQGSPNSRYAIWEIERAFCRLSAEQRDILVLRMYGYDHEGIARILGVSGTAARQRYSRARQQLRTALER